MGYMNICNKQIFEFFFAGRKLSFPVLQLTTFLTRFKRFNYKIIAFLTHFLPVVDALKRVFIFLNFFQQNLKAIRKLPDFINKWSKNGLNKNKNLFRIH